MIHFNALTIDGAYLAIRKSPRGQSIGKIGPLRRHVIDKQRRRAHEIDLFVGGAWTTFYASNISEAKSKVIATLVAARLEQS